MRSFRLMVIAILCHVALARAMDGLKFKERIAHEHKSVVLRSAPTSGKWDYFLKDLVREIQETYRNTDNVKKSVVAMNANIITDVCLLKELCSAHKKGVAVRLLVSEGSLGYMQKSSDWKKFLQEPLFPFRVFPTSGRGMQNHAKFFFTEYVDAQGQEHHCYSVGSSNFTPNGEFHNNEAVEVIKDSDRQNFDKIKNIFDDLNRAGLLYRSGESKEQRVQRYERQLKAEVTTPTKQTGNQRKIIAMSPEERTVYSSFEVFVWKSIAERLKKYVISDDSGFVYISSMTWNEPHLTELLCTLVQDNFEVTIFVDKAVLRNQGSVQQLHALVGQGADVFVYFGSGFKIQHAKFALIGKSVGDRQKHTVYSTTQNVSRDNNDVDLLVVDPENLDLFDDYLCEVRTYVQHDDMRALTRQNFDDLVKKSYASVHKQVPEKKNTFQTLEKKRKKEGDNAHNCVKRKLNFE